MFSEVLHRSRGVRSYWVIYSWLFWSFNGSSEWGIVRGYSIDKECSGAGTKHQLFELFLLFSESVDQKQWENGQGGVKS